MKLSFKFRIKDAATSKQLSHYAWACNQVWNYCCEIQRESERRRKGGRNVHWPTAFDLINLTAGSSELLGINAASICNICLQFARSRDENRRSPRFRASGGSRRALGWLPFKSSDVKIGADHVVYRKRKFRFWASRRIAGKIKTGAFVQDATNRWYVVFQCEVLDVMPAGDGEIGIDLGLKTLATCSDGTSIPALRHYRQYETALAVAQRAGNRRRAKAIHAKIANARKHHLHEWSTKIASENKLIVVGNVSPTLLVKTKMAKSILDASWSMLRSQLRYKANRHGVRYVEVDERWTSVTCSSCEARSGPKGIAGLRVRQWECSECGQPHDRDVNASQNILRAGLERQALAGEIFSPRAEKALTPMRRKRGERLRHRLRPLALVS